MKKNKTRKTIKNMDKKEDLSFNRCISKLSLGLNNLNNIFPIIETTLGLGINETNKDLQKFAKQHTPQNKKTLKLSMDDYDFLLHISKEVATFTFSYFLIPESLLIALIIEFDNFIANLIRVIYFRKPTLLSLSDKQYNSSEILSFKSIKEAKESIVQKEIEDILRNDKFRYFKNIESKVNLDLINNLENWSQFIEIIERRNLLVHSGGKVSQQYLNVCKLHKVKLPSDIKLGKKLYVDKKYFESSYECLFEIGLIVAYLIWKKLLPEQKNDADKYINNICFDLLKENKNILAKRILDFAVKSLDKNSNQANKYNLILNLALSNKRIGNKNKCNDIISSIDWSGSEDIYKMAVEILKGNFNKAATYMMSIDNKKISKVIYRTWPIFQDFRKTEDFLRTYRTKFKEKYKPIEKPPERVKDLTQKIEKLKSNLT